MIQPATTESEGAYVLSHRDLADVLSEADLGVLIPRLVAEIETVYRDRNVESVERTGWSRPPDALEVMGCQAHDFTCAKLISSVPGDNGGPTVTGTLVCTEIGTDQARLVCDAAFVTPLRTAASTAAVMRYAAPEVRNLGVVGAGLEGTTHAVVLALMIETIESISFYDLDRQQTADAAAEATYLLEGRGLLGERKIEIHECEKEAPIYECDGVITATFAERTVLTDTGRVSPGTFVAAVGADLESKRELPTGLYDRAKFIADDLRQCLKEGELQFAKTRFRLEDKSVDHRGEMSDGLIVSAATFLQDPKPFLEKRKEEIVIYDSTGFSGQDLAAARVLLRLLEERGWDRRPWNPPRPDSLIELLGYTRFEDSPVTERVRSK
jgi:ornithine cyclodeaminase/alanine dehydrogenase-like protein (mu-crystallin family)